MSKKRLRTLKLRFGYLQNGALAAGEVDLETNTSHLKAFPFLSYAVLHWPEHARSLARSEDIFDLSLFFYHKKSQIRKSWLETYWAVEENDNPSESFTLLHLASYFGILPLAENILLKNNLINKMKRLLYLNKTDDKGMTALHWAATYGHEAVMRLLLKKGADVQTKDKDGWTALHWAAEYGHEAVMRLLLEKGADIQIKDKYGQTALHLAEHGAEHGVEHRAEHEAVVRLLTPLTLNS